MYRTFWFYLGNVLVIASVATDLWVISSILKIKSWHSIWKLARLFGFKHILFFSASSRLSSTRLDIANVVDSLVIIFKFRKEILLHRLIFVAYSFLRAESPKRIVIFEGVVRLFFSYCRNIVSRYIKVFEKISTFVDWYLAFFRRRHLLCLSHFYNLKLRNIGLFVFYDCISFRL